MDLIVQYVWKIQTAFEVEREAGEAGKGWYQDR